MNKSIFSTAALAITACAFIISCNNDRSGEVSTNLESVDVVSKNIVKTSDLKRQLQYKKHYLQEAAKIIKELDITTAELIDLALDAEARGQQENTFLLKDIVEYAKNKNNNMDNTVFRKLAILNNAFTGLDDRNYNISIYIPFAEQVKGSNIKFTDKSEAANEDIFIFEEEDRSDIEYFEGYVLNEDGNYVSYEDLINEEMAEELAEQGRNVVIVGLQDANYNPGSGNGGTSTYTDKKFKIAAMTIKSHKESWAGGASDIAMQMYKYENGTLQKIDFINEGNSAGGAHNYFAKFTRSEVRDHNEKNLQTFVAGMIKTDPAVFVHSKFYYAVYETDNWPTTTRNVSFALPSGQTLNISFGSSDGEYYNSNANGNVFPLSSTHIINNSEIKFSSLLQ